MGLKFKVDRIDDVSEEQKKFYIERDGAFYLDVEGIPSSETADEVDRLNRALEKEKKDHRATKEKLRSFDEFGSIEDLREKIDEYEALKDGGGKASDELLNLKKELRIAQKERDSFKTQFESQKVRLDELTKLEKTSKVRGKLKEIVESLDGKYDKGRISSMLEDFEDSFDLDEVGDIAPYKGKPIKDWIQGRADLYNFTVQSSPGKSQPGNMKNKPEEKGDFISEIAAKLNG